ncbi:DNA polymerase alpha subunit B isoform 2-T2 [Clarias gariepinus]|uniref:DNA polymerase alpha subunit B isoform X2 n=1 Tax=Clarias gariepinus TaxID=13013 RepID=UPI00234D01EC|nr:DNA polymerase alpha subunit B isoform X2 [Clarias gariepinus]
MAAVTAENLKLELETFDIACEEDSVLDKMLEQCMCHRMKGQDIVFEWVAFSTTKGQLTLNLNNLESFEHEVLNKRQKTKSSSKNKLNTTRDVHSIQELIKAEEEEENLLESYSTPGKKRALTTPEHPKSKRSAARLPSPGLAFSPASFSPCATPSQKYSMRSARGEVVATFGSGQGLQWTGTGETAVQVELLECQEDSLTSSYKYMFQRLRDVRNVLTEKIDLLGEELRSHFNIEEFSPVSLPAQDTISVLGHVCCDSNGKLNAQSVLLEASQEHGARQVPVDVSELKDYSLFPGQVVVMEGMNTSGSKFVASKLYEGVPLPFYSNPELKQEMNDGLTSVMVLVACGPYTPSDSLAYDPLIDLINIINKDRPDVCILLGPFVDSKHEQIEKGQVTETFESIFSKCIESIVDGTRGTGCKLVFVPSQRDVHHHYIYPQPPFTLPDLKKDDVQRVTLASDPCTLLIGGVTFGMTSTDILFYMGAEEISCATGSDRFSRIMKHMLTQRSYYPLYPPAEEVNMDYERFQQYGQLPLTPDILIVPSELRYFIKDVIGCVCINPARLTKGQVGGTYGRLLIQQNPVQEEGKRVSPCIAAQVVKI